MGHDRHPTSETTASNPGSHGDVARHALDADVLDRIAVILRTPKREIAELVAETGRDVAGRDERSTATDTGVDAVAAALARADIAHTVDRVGGGVVVVTVPLRGGARIVIQQGGNVGHPAGWLAERYATAQAAAGETLVDGAADGPGRCGSSRAAR